MSSNSSTPIPIPRMLTMGLRAQTGSPPPAAMPADSRDLPRSPFTDLLPSSRTIFAYFQTIDATLGAAPAGDYAAWYGLRRLKVWEDTGQEITVFGARFTLAPCNVDGTAVDGAAEPLPWGDARGVTAALVIGRRLPIRLGAWTFAPANLPAIGEAAESGVADDTGTRGPGQPDYFAVETFPTGKFDDGTPNKVTTYKNISPYNNRVRDGETLDVALVMRKGYVESQTAKVIQGYALVEVLIGQTDIEKPFTA
ncbi:MAG: hypothetical protein KF768_00015 [Phycisphaeraceae bacterium]|nr:hypothetical protein [Phycisphaeraceae bacterium]